MGRVRLRRLAAWLAIGLIAIGASSVTVREVSRYLADPTARFQPYIWWRIAVDPLRDWIDSVQKSIPKERRLRLELSVVAAERRLAWLRMDGKEWRTRLLAETRLRLEVHGYRDALHALDGAWRPLDARSRLLAGVLTATLLAERATHQWRKLEWEALQATQRGHPDPGLGVAGFNRRANATWVRAFSRRRALGDQPMGLLAELFYFGQHGYPPGVRDSARDALSYLYVAYLCDQEHWRAEDFAALDLLSPVALLLQPPKETTEVVLTDPAVHPLVKACAVLGDLEAWHAKRGHLDGAVEAVLERARRLRAGFAGRGGEALGTAIEERLAVYRGAPWWSLAMATMALENMGKGPPPDLKRARALAFAGAQAHPGSFGAARCDAIVGRIDARRIPSFRVNVTFPDEVGRPSLEVIHKNLRRLYFRGWRADFDTWVASRASLTGPALNAKMLGLSIRGDTRPDAEWSAPLPPTPDSAEHRTLVVPKLGRPGLYRLIACDNPDFNVDRGSCQPFLALLTDLVAVESSEVAGRFEVWVISARNGQPIDGASVALLCGDSSHRVEASRTLSDHEGHATLSIPAGFSNGRCSEKWFVARYGSDRTLAHRTYDGSSFRDRRQLDTVTNILTQGQDFRSGESARWKSVTIHVPGDRVHIRPDAGLLLRVSLHNTHPKLSQETRGVTTRFGSLSGEFELPPDRGGSFSLSASAAREAGYSPAGAYGFKEIHVSTPAPSGPRVSLRPVAGPVTFGRPIQLVGEVRDAAGAPVSLASVAWAVNRYSSLVRPWPHRWQAPWPLSGPRQRLVVRGLARVAADGSFSFSFTPRPDPNLAVLGTDVDYRFQVNVIVQLADGRTCGTGLGVAAVRASVVSAIEFDQSFFQPGTPVRARVSRKLVGGSPAPGTGTYRLVSLRQPSRALLPVEEAPDEAPWKRTKGELERRYRTAGGLKRPRSDRSGWALAATLAGWAAGREIRRGCVETGPQGTTPLELGALPPGAYRLEYETLDDGGQRCTAAREFVVAGPPTPLAVPLALLAQYDHVRVGGTARFFLHCGLPHQPLMLEAWRHGRRSEMHWLRSDTLPEIIEVPIGNTERGGLVLRAWLVRDDQFIEASAAVTTAPDLRELQLDAKTVPDEAQRGTRIRWPVDVRRPDGSRVPSGSVELLAYLVQRGRETNQVQWNITRLYTSDLWAPRFATSLDWRVEGDYVRTPPPGGPWPEIPQTPRPTGFWWTYGETRGGDSSYPRHPEEGATPVPLTLTSPPLPPRKPGFWLPHLVTDRESIANVEATLPDAEGVWDFWVYAISTDGSGGSTHREMRIVGALDGHH
jgi:hypothetical protein